MDKYERYERDQQKDWRIAPRVSGFRTFSDVAWLLFMAAVVVFLVVKFIKLCWES